MSTTIEKLPFGNMPDGSPVFLFRFTNEAGAIADITNYGGRLVRILVPDKNGKLTSVIKGYETLEGFLKDGGNYLGAICGRYANRIAKAVFVADGNTYHLAVNNGPNSLHGGIEGFHIKCWDFAIEDEALVLTYVSKDMEEGFPGKLDVEVRYTWSETCELSMQITAATDKLTPVNITNHAYFNLNGEGDILGHTMRLNATRYVPIHDDAIPTGEIRFVKGTPFDFTEAKPIGKDIEQDDVQLKNGSGYDHCFVIEKEAFGDLALAAEATSPVTGITLKVFTTMPGVQFYSGNFLGSEYPGLEGKPYSRRQAFCLEPEFFPDTPNQSGFPTCMVKAGEAFEETLIFQFS